MHRSIRDHLTYANVMATFAVFLALGGVSYAATQLAKNSVGTKQLKNKAVTKAKVDPGLLASLAGQPGAAGATGAKGDAGAPGAAGTPGTNGADLTTHTPLGSGQTEVGVYALSTTSAPGSGVVYDAVTFPQPLPANLDPSHTIETSSLSATHCPGAGHADAGYLCLYRTSANNVTFGVIGNPVINVNGASKYGMLIAYTAVTQSAYAYGSWAVTAP